MATIRPTLDTLVQRRRTLNGMYQNTFWKHVGSGGIYKINSIGIRESDYAPIVHYTPVSHPDMEWDRPLSEWLEYIGAEAMSHPRFVRVEPVVSYV